MDQKPLAALAKKKTSDTWNVLLGTVFILTGVAVFIGGFYFLNGLLNAVFGGYASAVVLILVGIAKAVGAFDPKK